MPAFRPLLLSPLLPASLLLGSCNTAGFDAVSISPIYGWTEGCNTVRISGHGFAPDATVTLGDLDLAITTRGSGMDEGYWVEGALPANPVTSAGYATVTVNSGGKSDALPDAYYHVACPQSGYLESLDTETAASGQTVTLAGCSLDTSALQVRLMGRIGLPIVQVPLTAGCGTTGATFIAPHLPAGTYDLQVIDTQGAVVFPPYACPVVLDTADTGAPPWCPTLTFGADQ